MPRRPILPLLSHNSLWHWGLCWLLCLLPATGWAELASGERGEVLSRSYHFEEAKRDLSYALYVPTKYHAAKPAPLVVLLHGLGSNPKQVIKYQGVIEQAEK